MTRAAAPLKERARELTSDTAGELRDIAVHTSDQLQSLSADTLGKSTEIATDVARESVQAASDWTHDRYDDATEWAKKSPKRLLRWSMIALAAIVSFFAIRWVVTKLRNRCRRRHDDSNGHHNHGDGHHNHGDGHHAAAEEVQKPKAKSQKLDNDS